MSGPSPRALCAGCDRPKAVRADDMVRTHPALGTTAECSGSGRPPAVEVPSRWREFLDDVGVEVPS